MELKNQPKEHKSRRVLVVLVVLVLVSVVLGQPSFRQALDEATSHQPETFTELYFTDYKSLQKSLDYDTNYTGRFTIGNQEARPMVYVYVVSVRQGNTLINQVENTVSIANGQSKAIEFSYSAEHPGTKLNIVIELKNKPQQLHFEAMS